MFIRQTFKKENLLKRAKSDA